MPPKTFEPLTLDLIEEGRFLADAQAAFRRMQTDLIGHRKAHGDAAGGDKATLRIEVTLACDPEVADAYTIRAQTRVAMPPNPACVNRAMAAEDFDATPSLFVARSGATAAPPQQGRLATQDGRTVDAASGAADGPPPAK